MERALRKVLTHPAKVLLLLLAVSTAPSRARGGPVGPPAGGGLSPDDVILNKSTAQAGKTFNVSSATVSNLLTSTVTATAIKLNGTFVSTTSSNGSSVYPATSTILNKFGMTGSSVTATYLNASSGTVKLTSGTIDDLRGGTIVLTGSMTASNLSGTNSGDVSLANPTGLSLSGQTISLATATTVSTGALTSTDWNTFENKLSTTGDGSSLTGLTKTQVGLSNVQNLDQRNATNISTGMITSGARLATGTADSTTYLRGDLNWRTLDSTAVALGNVTNDAQVKIADYTQKGAILVGISTGVFAVLAPANDGKFLMTSSSSPYGVAYTNMNGLYSIYPTTAAPVMPFGFFADSGTINGPLTADTITSPVGNYATIIASNISVGNLSVSTFTFGAITASYIQASSGSLNLANLTGTGVNFSTGLISNLIATTLTSSTSTITYLVTSTANISEALISSGAITAASGNFTGLSASSANVTGLTVSTVTAVLVSGTNGSFSNIVASSGAATLADLHATGMTVSTATIGNATITNLTVDNLSYSTVTFTSITSPLATFSTATITLLNVSNAQISSGSASLANLSSTGATFATMTVTGALTLSTTTISDLVASSGTANLSVLTATSAVVQTIQGGTATYAVNNSTTFYSGAGSASFPSYSAALYPNSGWYPTNAGQWSLALNGSQYFSLATTGIVPVTGTPDLGSNSFKWHDIWSNGTANLTSVASTGTWAYTGATITGTKTDNSTTTYTAPQAIDTLSPVSGTTTVNGGIVVNGNVVTPYGVEGDNVPENLLPNGSFEANDLGATSSSCPDGSTVPVTTGWFSSQNGASTSSLQRDTTYFSFGQFGLRELATSGTPSGLHNSYIFYQVPNWWDYKGTTLTISATFRNTTGSAAISVGFYDGVTRSTSTQTINNISTGAFASCTKLISSSATVLQLEIGQVTKVTGIGNNGLFSVDGVMLNRGSTPAPFKASASNLTLPSGTSGYAVIGGAGGTAFLAGSRVVQTVNFTGSLSSSTISTTFVPSSLTASITPLYATSKIYVAVSATYEMGVSSSVCNYQIFRNTTNLGTTFGTMESSASGGGLSATVPFVFEGPLSMSLLDSPATTSPTSYTVYMRSQHAGSVNTCFVGTGEQAEIDLIEIGP